MPFEIILAFVYSVVFESTSIACTRVECLIISVTNLTGEMNG